MSCRGSADRTESSVLIGVTTQDAGYAKSLLPARLKYLSITKVEFHCLTQASASQFSLPAAPPRCAAGLHNQSHSFKAHIDYPQVSRQSIIFHSALVAVFVFVENTEQVCVWRLLSFCFLLENMMLMFRGRGLHSEPLISQVAGIKGMFLANKKTDSQVKTYITYNRGRDWRLLQAPSKDLRGGSIHCVLVSVASRACACPSKAGPDRSRLIPNSSEEPSELSGSEPPRLKGHPVRFSPISWPPI